MRQYLEYLEIHVPIHDKFNYSMQILLTVFSSNPFSEYTKNMTVFTGSSHLSEFALERFALERIAFERFALERIRTWAMKNIECHFENFEQIKIRLLSHFQCVWGYEHFNIGMEIQLCIRHVVHNINNYWNSQKLWNMPIWSG